MTDIPIKIQFVKSLSTAQPSRIVAVKADGDTNFTLYVTDKNGLPFPLKETSSGIVTAIQNTDGKLVITGSDTKTINVAPALLSLINSALQAGDNISELINDANYITLADIPAFVAADYDLEDFTNVGTDPYAHISDLSAGVTNLSYTASPTQGVVTSDTGTDATIPLADGTNAGLLEPSKYTILENTSGTNTGDQDLSGKQDNLVSGTNIKTIEGQSLLGSGNIDLAKSDVGLSNVDNTSDSNKPISTATQTALDGKQAALGYTPENVTNKTDSYTTSSSTAYVSGKALVDGLATKQSTLTNPLTGAGSNVDPNAYALQDGTILYHSVKWFAPTGTVSTSGTTVTSVGTQFTNAMVGAKLIINGEWRIITGYTSTTVVTVAIAYSQNYSGVVAGSWGVYSKERENTGGYIKQYTSFGFMYLSSELYTLNSINNFNTILKSQVGTNGNTKLLTIKDSSNLDKAYIRSDGTIMGQNVGTTDNALIAMSQDTNRTGLNLANNAYVMWGSTNAYYSTKDIGLRRNSAGLLELYNGVTADGTLTNRRDLLVRNVYSEPATLPNQVVTKAQLDLKADLASPTFTGTPTAPTATAGTNTTQVATTAFVTNGIATADSQNVKLTGNQTISGQKSFSLTGKIDMQTDNGFPAIMVTAIGSNVNSAAQFINNSSSPYSSALRLQTNPSAGGVGNITLDVSNQSSIGTGIFSNASSGGVSISSQSGNGDSYISNITYGGTGRNYVGRNNGIETYSVDKTGNVIGNSYIKRSTPANNILLAGGGDLAQGTAFNKNFGTTAGTVVEGNDSRILNGQTAFGWGNHAGLYPSLTGTGATGTWGINITGNATTATNIGWSGITSKPTTLAGYGITDASPASGSTNYIQNQNASAQSANMWISGSIKAGAATFASTVTATGGNFSGPTNFGTGISTTSLNGKEIQFYNVGASPAILKVADDATSINAIELSKSGAVANVVVPNGTVTASNGTLIGGTLTSGYIPKATGANSLGNSLIYDNGTNVGIGTASPSEKLEVTGTIKATSYTGSATLTGTPTAPTAATGTNTTQIATMAALQTALDSKAPVSGSANYIQNQNAVAQTANMWIDGECTFSKIGDVPDLRLSPVKYDSVGVSINKLSLYESSGGAWYGLGISSQNGLDFFSGDNGFAFYTGTTAVDGTGSSLKLRINNSGAATFASTVTATTFIGSLSGNASSASNATAFGGFPYGGVYSSGTLYYSTLFNSTTNEFQLADQSTTRTFLGLGSNAYTSTAYLPLTGGTLSGLVTAPTAAPGTTGNQIATLDYVLANAPVRPYKVWTGLVSQSGTSAPTAIVLENTLGGTITWGYTATGSYSGTLTGAFTANKTAILIYPRGASAGTPMVIVSSNPLNVNTISLSTNLANATATSVNGLIGNVVEIRVYN